MNSERVFKAYDIRGRTDNGDLTPELVRRVGVGFARIAASDKIAVGRDCRVSSPALARALTEGITSMGVDVLDLGEVATDTVYYVAGVEKVAGAMITASHNTSEYNGIKLCLAGALPVGADTGLADIKATVDSGASGGEGGGSVSSYDPIPGYVDHLFSIVDPANIAALRVAVDGGNGMAGVVLEKVFDRLEAVLIGLYLEPDGTFPNHPADPLQPENLRDLVALVEVEQPDLGVAFDGDADRAFFIDDRGRPVSGSTTTALIARWFLARHPGASIVHNLITSRAVPETITAHGGRPVRTRVGHSYIKKVMADTGSVFGGEHSGHYYFEQNFRADSGMLAMLVLLQVLSESGVPLSELRKEVELYSASGEINFEVERPEAVMAAVEAAFGDAEIDRLDGLTVSWEDRWFNLRASNTEPLIRLNAEAPDAASVEHLVEKVRSVLAGVSS